MKHVFPALLIVLSAIAVYTSFSHTADAAITKKPFGGYVIWKKSLAIQALEDTDFECTVPGTTIQIKPVGGAPSAYLIPYGTKSKTNTTIAIGQAIKGFYNTTKTSITCIYEDYPPVTVTVSLNSINMYGTSEH